MTSSPKASSGLFVPSRFGYREITGPITLASTSDLSLHLGYHPDKVFWYIGTLDTKSDVTMVGFEVFTNNIIFVRTKSSVTTLKKGKVSHFLRDFSSKDAYDSYTVKDTLDNGIANRSLDIDFLARVLNLKDPTLTGVLHAKSLKLNLYFEEGFLTDYSSSDGLEVWGKYFHELNPGLIGAYETQARTHWGDDIKRILNEVNIQADAIANVPDVINNHYVDLHRVNGGPVNYHMLLVCHYNKPITCDEFKTINHGRYEMLVETREGLDRYRLGLFTYEFDSSGKLVGRPEISGSYS